MTIALIDTHPSFRKGLSLFLNKLFRDANIIHSDSISVFNHVFNVRQRSIIILGCNNEDQSNHYTDILLTRKKYPAATIIIFDEDTNNHAALRYLEVGVKGYLTKQSTLSELEKCIDDVLQNKRFVSTELFNFAVSKFVRARHFPKKQLSSREFEIATLFSLGMKTSCIAKKLNRTASTVSTTKANIFKKLEVDNIIKLREILKVETK